MKKSLLLTALAVVATQMAEEREKLKLRKCWHCGALYERTDTGHVARCMDEARTTSKEEA